MRRSRGIGYARDDHRGVSIRHRKSPPKHQILSPLAAANVAKDVDKVLILKMMEPRCRDRGQAEKCDRDLGARRYYTIATSDVLASKKSHLTVCGVAATLTAGTASISVTPPVGRRRNYAGRLRRTISCDHLLPWFANWWRARTHRRLDKASIPASAWRSASARSAGLLHRARREGILPGGA
jgi:hypothetical protein